MPDVSLPPSPELPHRTVSSAMESLMEALSLRQGPAPPTAPPKPPPNALSPPAAPVYTAGAPPASTDAIMARRNTVLGPTMALFFKESPIHAVRGRGCEIFDDDGTAYLDCINNVAHVGHCHPRVAAAVSKQLFTLNTNSRYPHEGLVAVAERLVELSPAPLSVVYPVVSGSEANDLAWRIACAAAAAAAAAGAGGPPGNQTDLHVACVDHGYHGHTSTVIQFSPYKFWGPGGRGKAVHVHVLPCPDPYRGLHLDGGAAAAAAVAAAEAAGGRIAAFFCESVISCGGQVVLPPGWLAGAYAEFRSAGAVCVADEVQCGFGRVGSAFWAFQTQGVVPDIVTCGKPMGNGFPCAAVLTTPALAAAFDPGMEFFATGAGCTASAAAALAVLDVMRDEGLQANAAEVGAHTLAALRELQTRYPEVIGDVRGVGLMIGVELVTDVGSKAPAPATAAWVKAWCRSAHRVLLSTEGPYSNVIKIKPPVCFTKTEANRMVAALAGALAAIEGLDSEAAAQLRRQNEEEEEAVKARREALGAQLVG